MAVWVYWREMVARRLTPLVVAFALAFAPIARAACDVSCLEHSVAAAAEDYDGRVRYELQRVLGELLTRPQTPE